MRAYSQRFREQMVRKMVGPPVVSATALSQEIGVCQSTLSRWFREASRVESMSKKKAESRGARRPQDWSATEKLAAVAEASALSEEALGVFLRERGLRQAQLDQWRSRMLEGLESQPKKPSASQARQVRSLERELRRKDKALAEASALLILKKKAAAIWGDEDDDTTGRNET